MYIDSIYIAVDSESTWNTLGPVRTVTRDDLVFRVAMYSAQVVHPPYTVTHQRMCIYAKE